MVHKCLVLRRGETSCGQFERRYCITSSMGHFFNTLRRRQNGRRFPDDLFKCIFLNENIRILIKISLKFIPKDIINNIPSLVHIMAWWWPGNKPLSEQMMNRLPTHSCITQPQRVKTLPLGVTDQISWKVLGICHYFTLTNRGQVIINSDQAPTMQQSPS